MQCYLPELDLPVPGPAAVLLELVGSCRVNPWKSLVPGNTQQHSLLQSTKSAFLKKNP